MLLHGSNFESRRRRNRGQRMPITDRLADSSPVFPNKQGRLGAFRFSPAPSKAIQAGNMVDRCIHGIDTVLELPTGGIIRDAPHMALEMPVIQRTV
jgi:hypothetical protein